MIPLPVDVPKRVYHDPTARSIKEVPHNDPLPVECPTKFWLSFISASGCHKYSG